MKVRKKPVVVDAYRWVSASTRTQGAANAYGMNAPAYAPDWFADAWRDRMVNETFNDALNVVTLEGLLRASDGDYVIRGVRGELYPCKPDIFEETYEVICRVCEKPREDHEDDEHFIGEWPYGDA